MAIGSFWEDLSAVIFPRPFSDIEQNLFGILSRIYQLGCQNCILRVPKNSLSWKNFAKVVEFYLSLSDFRTKKSCFLVKKVRQGCQKAILHVYGTHSRRRFPLEFFLSHSEIDRKIPAFCRKIFVRFVRTGFYLSQEAWWGGNKFKEKFLVIFFVQTSIENLPAFCRKFFHRIVKTAFYVSIATFWNFSILVFRCWAENHRHFVTNFSTGLSKLISKCT